MKLEWRSALYWITSTTFMVVTLLSIANSVFDSQVSDLGIETIAPANLANSHLSLEAGLRVEARDFPVDRLTTSAAYRQHLARLAAYAKRLEVHHQIERRRSFWLSRLSLAASFAMLTAVILNKKRNEKTA